MISPPVTLRDALRAAYENRAADPAARHAFGRLAAGFGTPLYVYDRRVLETRFDELRQNFASRFRRARALTRTASSASIVTVPSTAPEEVDDELVAWIRAAFDAGGRDPAEEQGAD